MKKLLEKCIPKNAMGRLGHAEIRPRRVVQMCNSPGSGRIGQRRQTELPDGQICRFRLG